VEDFFVRPPEGRLTPWWGALEGGFLDGAMLRITKNKKEWEAKYILKRWKRII
jgi:hypothetical protein